MLAAGICVALLLFLCWHGEWDRKRPLDEDEMRFLRRLADRIRAEEEIYHH
jgi:hypothetical protein